MRLILTNAFILIHFLVYSQDRTDHILMLSGENKSGQVVGLTDETVDFIHTGETLKYTLKKSEISKIEFASGRIEVFNEIPTAASQNAELVDHHNKVAVLPFTYIRDGEQKKNDAMERKVQQELVAVMSNHVGIMKIQPTVETNAILAKAGINNENFIQFTMPELANMLGVEYIIQTTLSISEQGATSYNSSSVTINKNQEKNRVSGFSSSSSSTQIQFQTEVDMLLYNDKGDVVWSKSKESFWPNEDAYQQTLKFLLKRMPIYSK